MKQVKGILLLMNLICLLDACSCYKKNQNTSISEVDGHKLISNPEKGIYLYYYGDYWFHDLKKKQTLNWNDDFVKSIGRDKHRKDLLFAGHTIIEPYCSSIGILYRKAKSVEIAKEVAQRMRKELKAENVFVTVEMINMFNYTIVTYDLKDWQLKVSARYREYYSDEGEDVLRLVFWSAESHKNWEFVENESRSILEKRSLLKP